MIPLAVPNVQNGKEAEYLQECIDSTFVSSVGPFVDRFEKMTADLTGADESVAVVNGTSGLHMALRAVGVSENDLVILPGLSFIASANAVAYCGASPLFLDIGEDDLCLDVDELHKYLSEKTVKQGEFCVDKSSNRRVSAIMPVYTIGTPAKMDRITEIASKFNIPVIADAAAAIGSTYKGKLIGELGADLTVMSFNGNKTLTAGGGGAVVSNNDNLIKDIKHLTTTAKIGSGYEHDVIGYNYRMTNINAAVGCAQLEQLDYFVERKQQIAKRYNQELGNESGCGPMPFPHDVESACWLSGIILDHKYDFSKLCRSLISEGIGVKEFWRPLYSQKSFADCIRMKTDVVDDLWHRILTLPCSTGLTDDEQSIVIDAVKKFI
jgi:aminotransferase in exopolysaccharide biosynthesis